MLTHEDLTKVTVDMKASETHLKETCRELMGANEVFDTIMIRAHQATDEIMGNPTKQVITITSILAIVVAIMFLTSTLF